MSGKYSERKKTKARVCYLRELLEQYDEVSEYKATRIAGSRVKEEFPNVNRRSLSEWTTEYRKNSGNNIAFNSAQEIKDALSKLENKLREEFDDEEKEKKEGIKELYADDRYYYIEDSDLYLVFHPHHPKPLLVPGDLHREMKRAYSNWTGEWDTINELVRKFPYFTHNGFMKYKQIFNWSHSDAPFTDEELKEKTEDEMVEEFSQMKKQKIYKKIKKNEEKERKELAEKMRELDVRVLEPLNDRVHDEIPDYDVPEITVDVDQDKDIGLVSHLFDLHYGRKGWYISSEDSGRQAVLDDARETIEMFVEDAVKLGNIEKTILCMGSDFLHVDNVNKTTTKGTQLEIEGSFGDLIYEANEFVADFVNMWRQASDEVVVRMVPGNHDFSASHYVVSYLEGFFRDEDDVTVHLDRNPQVFDQYRDFALGFSHGRDEKRSKLGPILKDQDVWREKDTERGVFFVGDKHHSKYYDKNGVTICQTPALAKQDLYETRQGFSLSQRGNHAYVLLPERCDIYPLEHTFSRK